MIPKIIHQIWIGPHPAPLEIMRTWQEMHPDWEYRFWDNDAIAAHTFRNQRQIDASEPQISGKCNVMRYEILHEFGGIYMDADYECLRPLDDSFLQHDSFAAWEQERLQPGLIANGSLGTTKGNDLMRLMIEELERMDNVKPPSWKMTGPGFLTRMVQQHSYDRLKTYPSHYFNPVHWSGLTYHGDDKSYAHHYWGSSINLSGGSYDKDVAKKDVSVPQHLLKNARMYRRDLEIDKALVLYEALSEEASRSSNMRCLGLIGASKCLRQLGRVEQGLRFVQQAVEEFPTLIEARTAMAVALWESGDCRRAEPLLKAILEGKTWAEPIPEFPYRRSMMEEILFCCKSEMSRK